MIEIIIYVALISLIFGFILAAVYQIIDSKDAYQARVDVSEETNFLVKKIEWLLANAAAINQPASGATSTALSVNMLNFFSNPVVLNLSGSDALISYAGVGATVLNSGSVAVKNMVFENISGGNNPAVNVKLGLEYRFNDLKTPKPSSTIETTIYLRQK